MHDLLFERPDALDPVALRGHAARLGLDEAAFEADLREGRHAARVAQDVNSAEEAGVAGTPSFFVNEVRYRGAYDLDSMEKLLRRVLRIVESRARVAAEEEDGSAGGEGRDRRSEHAPDDGPTL
jgi:predicted DsbA family dithiol-disulfide isomerase